MSGGTTHVRASRVLVDTGVVVAAVVVAMLPLQPVFDSAQFWIVVAGGVVAGAAIGLFAGIRRLPLLVVAGLVVLAYMLLGGALALPSTTIAGVIPTLDTLAGLLMGAVQSWKQLVTLDVPVTGFEQLLLVPFLATLVVTTCSLSLALRLRQTWPAALPIGALLPVTIVLSTDRAFWPAPIGIAVVLLLVPWAVWRRRQAAASTGGELAVGADAAAGRTAGRRRAMVGGAMLALAAIIGGAVSVAAPPVGARVVARDLIVPPLDLHAYASPIVSFRKFVRDGDDVPLFAVRGLPVGASIRLATLDLYDGIVYQVAGDGTAGSGTFSRVGSSITPDASLLADEPTAPMSIEVTVAGLRGVWLPEVGAATAIRFDGDAAARRAASLHYNRATWTAISTTGLAEGDTYTVDAELPSVPDLDDLADVPPAAIVTPKPRAVPPAVEAAVAQATEGAKTQLDQLRAIEAWLGGTGFFSHGLEGEVTSRSGHTAERISSLLTGTQMIGDDEQYAVAMALMVAQLGLPVRVVLGFQPTTGGGTVDAASTSDVTVTGKDAHVWVEVPFAGHGWVAFDPTPPQDRVPQEEVPDPKTKPQAQVPQPPPPAQEPVELPPDPPVEDVADGDTVVDLGWLWMIVRIGGISLLAVAALIGPAIALGLLRAGRRRSRERSGTAATRITGGWSELVDTASDLGTRTTRGATRREDASRLAVVYPELPIPALATAADTGVFGPGEPSEAEVVAYWADVDTVLAGLRRSAPRKRRILARIAPGSVLRDLRARWSAGFGRKRRSGDGA